MSRNSPQLTLPSLVELGRFQAPVPSVPFVLCPGNAMASSAVGSLLPPGIVGCQVLLVTPTFA